MAITVSPALKLSDRADHDYMYVLVSFGFKDSSMPKSNHRCVRVILVMFKRPKKHVKMRHNCRKCNRGLFCHCKMVPQFFF